mmetsp:Transcript_58098/g.138341  ORF Transcript_58098/g.138341 Transcript_58098/m.138341 type:complete len:222 (+) Transcript_58098:331-996(+)
MHHVRGNVNGCPKEGEASDGDVEVDRVVNWNPLAGRACSPGGSLQTLEGGKHQHGKVQVHGVAPALGQGIGPGALEAPAEVGQHADEEHRQVQQAVQESGQPVLTEAASLAATVEALDPGQLLVRHRHVCCLPGRALLVRGVGTTLFGPGLPALGYDLAPLLDLLHHALLLHAAAQDPRPVAAGKEPAAGIPVGPNRRQQIQQNQHPHSRPCSHQHVLVEL